MPASRHQRLLDGTLADPCERFFCHVFDAIAAVVASVVPEAIGAEALGAGLGGEIAGGFTGGVLGGGLEAGTGALTAGLSGAEALGGVGGLGAALGGGSDLLAGMGALEAGGDAALGGGSLVPGGALTTGTGVGAQTALPAVSAGTGIGGPAAAAPILPASVGAAPATVTGDLSGALGGGTGTTGAAGSADLSTADFSAMDAPGATGTTATTGSKGGLIDRTLSSLTGGAVNKSDLGTILSGGGLLMNLMGGNKSLPGEKQLSGAASGLEATARGQAALGTQLEGFLQSGKLPPGLESGLRSATNAATATIKAQHAAHGTSGSSAEASDIQAANDRALAAGQQVALQLLQQGATMVGQAANTEGMAAQLYQAILANSLEKDRELGSSIGNFASALARSGDSSAGNSTITLKAA